MIFSENRCPLFGIMLDAESYLPSVADAMAAHAPNFKRDRGFPVIGCRNELQVRTPTPRMHDNYVFLRAGFAAGRGFPNVKGSPAKMGAGQEYRV